VRQALILKEAYLIFVCQQLILFKVFPVHLWVAFCALGWGTASIAQVSPMQATESRLAIRF